MTVLPAMKHFIGLLLIFALLAGCRTTRVPAAADVGTLKIATLNLYHDKDDWPRRRVQIVEEFRRQQPDAIALQEVIQREGLVNQAEWLAGQLGYAWHFVSTDPAGKPMRYGNAILTRHPILLRGEERLRPLDDSRTAGLLRIEHARTCVEHLRHPSALDGPGRTDPRATGGRPGPVHRRDFRRHSQHRRRRFQLRLRIPRN